MKRLILVLIAVFASLTAAQAALAQDPDQLYREKCTKCHTLERTERMESPEFWRETVNRMQDKWFSGISEEEAQIIMDYLIMMRGK